MTRFWRAAALLDAGADHICLQVLPSDPAGLPRRELAEALIGWRQAPNRPPRGPGSQGVSE